MRSSQAWLYYRVAAFPIAQMPFPVYLMAVPAAFVTPLPTPVRTWVLVRWAQLPAEHSTLTLSRVSPLVASCHCFWAATPVSFAVSRAH